MSNRITQQELESYLWGAAVYLRGTIDAGDYKQFIFPLLFYKRVCDVFDEETRAALAESGGDEGFAAYPENHRFQVPADAHWRRVRNTASEIGQALQSGMRAIETANPDKLFGIFGDAQWTNKDRLSDAMLRDLAEHFSALDLSIANLPEDELGQGYEYLIKKFADDSGHTAAEFYTNRTVVHLMTELLEPQPGESIYDPTCGSGGMLLSTIAHLRRQGKEWRNVRLYGQERNLMTSSIARMNCFLHGIEDFQIVRGDTLSDPKFIQGDRLMQFDVVLANPPYSIKQWDRAAFAADPWGRNIYGTPPQGRADYAFWQHILCSLRPDTGRSAILFPHGVLFRQEEAEMRRRLIEADVIECVLGLGPNLFYNSPMEACVVICRTTKPSERRGRILFINAIDQVTRERAQSFLADEHIERIVEAYRGFTDEPGFTRVATLEEVRARGGSLSIPLYVSAEVPTADSSTAANGDSVEELLAAWVASAAEVRSRLSDVLETCFSHADLPVVHDIVGGVPEWMDHKEWRHLPFGAFADSISDRVEPGDAAEEIYVGLGDLDSGGLHIRRWGRGGDVIGTKLRFREGDIIFGRRRAYQRKLAVAEFDGICSAHAMVVRAKPDMVLPEFLPFLMMSDAFMNRAMEISVGSLSPTINWTTLRREEFGLPPLDQQRRIAEMLWAIDDVRIGLEVMHSYAVRLVDALADERLADAPFAPRSFGDFARAGELHIQTGPFGTVLQASSYAKTGTPIINPVNMVNRRLVTTDGPFLSDAECDRLARYRMEVGDILLARKGDVGRAVLVTPSYAGFIVGSDLMRLRLLTSEILPEYLFGFLLAPRTRSWIARHASGTTMPGINERVLNAVTVPIPPLEYQVEMVRTLTDVDSATRALADAICGTDQLLLSIANQLMEGVS